MRFLLIDAMAAGMVGRAVAEWIPSGIRSLAGILEERGIEYDIVLVENFLKKPERYARSGPFLVTGMSSDLPMIRRAGRKIKGLDVPFILGGPVAFEHLSVLSEIGPDMVIIGEGEKTFLELLEAGLAEGELPDEGSLSGIPGLAYRSKEENGLKSTATAGFLTKEELNAFSPSTKAIEHYPFHQNLLVVLEILRGCSNFNRVGVYHDKECAEGCERCRSDDLSLRLDCPQGIPPGCGFCSVGAYGPPRSRGQEKIMKEVKGLIDCGATKITIQVPDPLDYKREELVAPKPLTDPSSPGPNYGEIEKLGEMLWEIPEIADESVGITVRDVKATLVNDRSVRLLKRYFPRSIFGLGGETGSREHALYIGRPYGPEKIVEAVEIFNRNGIKPRINFILGLPGQTEKTVQETLEMMNALKDKVLYYDLFRFEALPRSAFDDKPSDIGPMKDENSRRLVAEVNSSQKRLFKRFIGERWEVVIGKYETHRKGEKRKKDVKIGAPKRRFRQLAGVVGYPIFDKRQLSQLDTVVKILDPPEGLKPGEVAVLEITGAAEHGFRVVLEGLIEE